MTVPLYSARKRSSQATDSASRWFVGSSRRSRSGEESSSRQRATRRASPPERLLSVGGDAPALATREACDVAVAVGEAQGVHRAIERRVEAPGVVAVDLLLHLR